MKPVAAPVACAMGVLVLFLVLGIVLIPILDAELRRATARRAAALAKLAQAQERKDRIA